MRSVVLLAVGLLLLLLLTACVTRPAGVRVDRGGTDLTSLSVGDVRLSWRFGEELVFFELGAPANGWLGIAFAPLPGRGTGAVGGANVIAGYVTDGAVVVRDDFGCESYEHCADTAIGGTNDVSEVSGEESPGWTEIRFAVPREPADELDVPLEPGRRLDIVVGYGFLDRLEDNWFARHKISITL